MVRRDGLRSLHRSPDERWSWRLHQDVSTLFPIITIFCPMLTTMPASPCPRTYSLAELSKLTRRRRATVPTGRRRPALLAASSCVPTKWERRPMARPTGRPTRACRRWTVMRTGASRLHVARRCGLGPWMWGFGLHFVCYCILVKTILIVGTV